MRPPAQFTIMKLVRKIISVMIAAAAAAFALFGTVPASAFGETTGEVNVIFLVDSSRSMLKSDPDMIRIEAIKLFADLCKLGKTKIGFVLFGSEILYEQAPLPINTDEDRAAVKNKADELTKLKGSTDIGLALLHTVSGFASDGDPAKGKFIVFLSDGKTVITGNDKSRTEEDSAADVEKGISLAREAGIPIYTIGLNASEKVDEDLLRRISSQTYADDTYMTSDAGELSEILSDIYVRHTGAENKRISGYTSAGGAHDTEFVIEDGAVVEADLLIMHSAKLDDIKVKDPKGGEVLFDGKQADITYNEGHTLVKLYSPSPGKWDISVTSPADTKVDISYILARDFSLSLSLSSDKAISAGAKLKLEASLTDLKGVRITDSAILDRLVGKAVLKNEASGETTEVTLYRSGDTFTGECGIPSDDGYTIRASIYNNNIDIRGEIITLANGEEKYKEPEGPLRLILICAGAAAVLIAVIIVIIKYRREHRRMWSGRLVITVNAGGIPSMPMQYDFAKKSPGKRKVILYDVLKALSDDAGMTEAIPRSVTSAVAITMNSAGDLRIVRAKGAEYSGGIIKGKNIMLSGTGRLTMRCADKAAGSNNMMIIQYMRT